MTFKTETAKNVFYRTYSRTKPDGSQETWPETVQRVVDGNLKLVDPRYIEEGEREALLDLIGSMKVLPAGRHLRSSGVNSFALNNCWAAGWDPAKPEEHFTFTLLRLAEGGGVGANYSSNYFEDFPPVQVPVNVHIVCDLEHPDYEDMVEAGLISTEYSHTWAGAYAVEDSREGWAEALGDLIRTAHDPKTRHTQRVYDVSRIRPKGSPLKTFGGTASGPEPFAEMMWEVGNILSAVFYHAQQFSVDAFIDGLDAMRIDHAIAKAIVAGGVRRSARMSIMRWDDPQIFDFINIKKNGGHWTTNISVEIDQDFMDALNGQTTEPRRLVAADVLNAIAEGMLHNGEPGVWNSALTVEGEVDGTYTTNPCISDRTWIHTTEGPKRVKELIGKQFTALLDGKPFDSDERGFYKTGTKPVFRVKTNEGYELECTSNQELYRPDGTRVEVSKLTKGDKIAIVDQWGASWDGRGAFEEGYAIGHLVGDGSFDGKGKALLYSWTGQGNEEMERVLQDFLSSLPGRSDFSGWSGPEEGRRAMSKKSFSELAESYGVVRGNKRVTEEIERTSSSFYAGFLRGLFDTDGHVEGNTQTGFSVRLSSTDKESLKAVQRMLARMGIKSSIRLMHPSREKEMPGGTYTVLESFRLIISGRVFVQRFAEAIGFLNTKKAAKLQEALSSYTREPYAPRMYVHFEGMEEVGTEDVYDCTIPGPLDFDGNGIRVRDCGEATLTPWEPCNLGSVNLAAFVDSDGFVDVDGLDQAHRYLTRYLIRATFAEVADPKSAEAIARYRRIGVGHLGFADYLYKQGLRYTDAPYEEAIQEDLMEWARVVDEAAVEYANELRIPVPIKKRVIAPTGTISKLAGVSGEATHAPFADYFIRRIRFSDVDPNEVAQVEEYRRKGYRVEPCQYADNTTVVEIPTKDSLLDELDFPEYFQHAGELTIRDMLNVQRLYQKYWADQAVSYTVNVDPEKYTAGELAQVLSEYLPELKGTTVFPEMSMPQSPYERISFEEYKARAEEVGIEVTDTSYDSECASGACPV